MISSRTDLHWTPISLSEKWKVRMILLVIKPPHPLPKGRSQLLFAMAIPGTERARGSESKRPCLRGHGLPPASSLPKPVLSWRAATPLSAHGCQEPSFRLCGNAPRSPEPSRPVVVEQQLRREYVVDSKQPVWKHRKWTEGRGGTKTNPWENKTQQGTTIMSWNA